MNYEEGNIQEAVDYIRSVFPSKAIFDLLVEQGADGTETHTITGDDLAGACWHLNELIKVFGVRND